jgi:hypothetical protein
MDAANSRPLCPLWQTYEIRKQEHPGAKSGGCSWQLYDTMIIPVIRYVLYVKPADEKYSDASYLATVITAISNAFTACRQEEVSQAMEAIDRAITMDRLVSSFQNIVTEAGLRAILKFVVAGHRTNDSRLFLSYTRWVSSVDTTDRLEMATTNLCESPPSTVSCFVNLQRVVSRLLHTSWTSFDQTQVSPYAVMLPAYSLNRSLLLSLSARYPPFLQYLASSIPTLKLLIPKLRPTQSGLLS